MPSGLVARVRRELPSDRGSASVEFVLVGVILTALTLAVIQLGLALHIRNTLLDAAAEGAQVAALAGNDLDDGVLRTRDLIRTAIGPDYASDVSARQTDYRGVRAAEITVRAPLPMAGLLGPARSLEVVGHAALESLDR